MKLVSDELIENSHLVFSIVWKLLKKNDMNIVWVLYRNLATMAARNDGSVWHSFQWCGRRDRRNFYWYMLRAAV
jgi:hypothetical protein